MNIIPLEDGNYRVEFMMMGCNYVELFNKNGEYIKFIGQEFPPWKDKNLITIIMDYKNEYIDNQYVKQVLDNLIKNISVNKELNRKIINQNDIIDGLKIENNELDNEIKANEQHLKDSIKQAGGLTDKILNEYVIENSQKHLLSMYGAMLPKYFNIDYFNDSIDDSITYMYHFLELLNNTRFNNNIPNNDLMIIAALLLDSTKNNTGKYNGDLIENIDFNQYYPDNGNDLNNIVSLILENKGDITPLKINCPRNIEFDNNYFSQLRKKRPLLSPIIDQIQNESLRNNESIKHAEELKLRVDNTIKFNNLVQFKEEINKKNTLYWIVLIITVLIIIVSVIVSIVMASKSYVKFESSDV